MKYSLAITSLVSAGVLLLGCSSEDSDPPPVAAPAQMNPLNPAAPSTPAAPGAGSTETPAAAAPGAGTTPTPEQPAAGAPLAPSTPPAMNGTTPPAMTGTTPPAMMPAMNTGGAPAMPETPPPLTIDDLVGDLDGHLFSVACGDTPNTDDCAGEGWRSSRNPGQLNACVGGRLQATINFPVRGEAGTSYDVRMHFYGVMEPRNYGAVVQREATGRPNLTAGGTPTPYASTSRLPRGGSAQPDDYGTAAATAPRVRHPSSGRRTPAIALLFVRLDRS